MDVEGWVTYLVAESSGCAEVGAEGDSPEVSGGGGRRFSGSRWSVDERPAGVLVDLRRCLYPDGVEPAGETPRDLSHSGDGLVGEVAAFSPGFHYLGCELVQFGRHVHLLGQRSGCWIGTGHEGGVMASTACCRSVMRSERSLSSWRICPARSFLVLVIALSMSWRPRRRRFACSKADRAESRSMSGCWRFPVLAAATAIVRAREYATASTSASPSGGTHTASPRRPTMPRVSPFRSPAGMPCGWAHTRSTAWASRASATSSRRVSALTADSPVSTRFTSTAIRVGVVPLATSATKSPFLEPPRPAMWRTSSTRSDQREAATVSAFSMVAS